MQSSNVSNAHSGSREPPSATKGACLAAGLALGAVTLAAALLRCWQMGESLWIDELHTAWTAADGLAQVAPRAWIGNQSPLYFYLVWGLVKLFGLSEPVVRLPSLLAGVALVPAMYFVLLRWTGSKTAGLLAAVLTAVDPHCLLYSLEARPYALVQLLALAHVWVFSELLWAPSNGRARPLPSRNVPTNVAARREPRPPDVKSSSEASASKRPVHRGILPWRLAFILGAAVLFYLHYTAALLLPAEVLAYVALWPWRRRRMAYRAWQFALDLAIVALAWSPAVWHLREIAARRENWSFVQQGPITATPFWFPLPYALLWPAVLLAAAALIQWLLRRRALAAYFSLPLAVLAAGWEFVPALIAWVATQLDVARLFHLRYLNVSVPAAPAIAGLLCGWTAGRAGRLAQLVVISAAAVYASNLVPLYLHDGRFAAHDSEDWRAAVQLVNEHRGSGPAPVLVYSGLIEARQMAHGGQSLRRYLLLPVTGIYRLEGDDRLLVALPESGRVRFSSAQREGAEDAGNLWLLVRGPAAEVEFFKREVLAMLVRAGVPAEQVSVMRQPFGDVTVFRLSWRSAKGVEPLVVEVAGLPKGRPKTEPGFKTGSEEKLTTSFETSRLRLGLNQLTPPEHTIPPPNRAEKTPMAVRNENSAPLAHLLEMTIAVGVLAAVLIPALVIPAVQAARQVSAGERKKEEEPNPALEALTARLNCAKQLRGVVGEPVSAEFATEAVHRLSDRFEISRQMVIARRKVTDADVEELVRYMKMGEAPWTPGRSTELLAWEWLIYCDSVNLSGSEVTDAAVERLAALPQIQDLNLADTRVSDKALVFVGRLPALFQLDVSGTSVTDQGLSSLAPCRTIECLDLSNTQIGDEGLAAFRNHQKLTSLYLANSKVTGASLELISSFKSLQDLNLDHCSIDNQDDLRFLSSLEQLASLSMQHTQVGDEGAVLLSEIEGLWDLHLEGTRIGRTGRVALKAGLPECMLSL